MILATLVAASAWTVAVPVGASISTGSVTKDQISHAATACGTSVVFTDLPQATQLTMKSAFGFNIDPHATAAKVQCFFHKIPSTRIGFITEPQAPQKKN